MKKTLWLAVLVVAGAALLSGCMRTASPPVVRTPNTPGPKIILTKDLDLDGDGTIDVYAAWISDASGSHETTVLAPTLSIVDSDLKLSRKLFEIPNAQFLCDNSPVPAGKSIFIETGGLKTATFEVRAGESELSWTYKPSGGVTTTLHKSSSYSDTIPREFRHVKSTYYDDGGTPKTCAKVVMAGRYTE